MRRDQLTFSGWGLIGEPEDDVIVSGPSGDSLDVTGYNEVDYWRGGEFLGADNFGITPIYQTEAGDQFPEDARQMPYIA